MSRDDLTGARGLRTRFIYRMRRGGFSSFPRRCGTRPASGRAAARASRALEPIVRQSPGPCSMAISEFALDVIGDDDRSKSAGDRVDRAVLVESLRIPWRRVRKASRRDRSVGRPPGFPVSRNDLTGVPRRCGGPACFRTSGCYIVCSSGERVGLSSQSSAGRSVHVRWRFPSSRLTSFGMMTDAKARLVTSTRSCWQGIPFSVAIARGRARDVIRASIARGWGLSVSHESAC